MTNKRVRIETVSGAEYHERVTYDLLLTLVQYRVSYQNLLPFTYKNSLYQWFYYADRPSGEKLKSYKNSSKFTGSNLNIVKEET